MITQHQIEERLASAIREYVRACGNVRRAEIARAAFVEAGHSTESVGADARARSARHIAATAKKILRGIEQTFVKLGGDFDSMSGRLRLAPGRPWRAVQLEVGLEPIEDDEVEDMTADAGCDTVAE